MKENWFKIGLLVCAFIYVLKGYIQPDYEKNKYYVDGKGIIKIDKEEDKVYIWYSVTGEWKLLEQ